MTDEYFDGKAGEKIENAQKELEAGKVKHEVLKAKFAAVIDRIADMEAKYAADKALASFSTAPKLKNWRPCLTRPKKLLPNKSSLGLEKGRGASRERRMSDNRGAGQSRPGLGGRGLDPSPRDFHFQHLWA
ncbi:MAG: hypothetical protein LBP95_04135 [Deltaproteobacteria bacterium]|jgi:hypothetical protein|nr:hypothetical protein [Deltaproteobacteria bacterium]